MKKETLEDFIKVELEGYDEIDFSTYERFIKLGAKWQKEKSYSEEDLKKAFIAGGNSQIEEDDAYGSAYMEYMEEWFEQFKKK
jgi:hypothetical protein